MPAAMPSGSFDIARSKRPENPAIASSSPHSMNAPIASGIDTPATPVTSIAAPGVDQAVTTGARQRNDRPMQVTPMPMPSAPIHEPSSTSFAPSARAASNTIAAELV